MAFATYRLYYETEILDQDAYDAACADFYGDSYGDYPDEEDFYVEESLCVAVLVIDLDTPGENGQEMQLALLPPGSPAAPEWYTEHEAGLVAEQIHQILKPQEDGTIEVLHPEDPSFELEVGAVVPAEDFDAATLMALDSPGLDRLYPVFCIEYQIDAHTDPFPVAVFSIDAVEGRIHGLAFGSDNPFAPRHYTRTQRRKVDRRLKAMLDAFEKLAQRGPEGGMQNINPARIMGPEFRTMGLPDIEAGNVVEAVEQAVNLMTVLGYLREAEEAS